jgi:ketosteroid isomerase-like protein
MTEQETFALLEEIGGAFARHDVSAMVGYFAKEGAFVDAVGPDPFGTCYQGHDEIRCYFDNLFDITEEVQWEKLDARVAGDKAYTEWHRRATLKSDEK